MKKNQKEKNNSYSGYVAIVGRPNVGKSTLLNRILGEKLSITSDKPQTTRHRILGIKTLDNLQTIYVDTPGLHIAEHSALNRHMNKAARNALKDVDIILFVIEGLKWTAEDEWVAGLLKDIAKPVILVINKMDTVPDKKLLLARLQDFANQYHFLEMIPISATQGTQVDTLQSIVANLLPEGPHYFPDDAITDRSMRFRVAEIIREKLTRSLGEELPYSLTVEIESLKEEDYIQHISAIIWVEREGQKPIVIGKKGERLKSIGIQSRKDIEILFNQKVNLKLWVKVRGGWSDDDRALASLGYIDTP
jgi:GTP-binding protein Era